MAKHEENLDQWFNIPAGSTIAVTVTPEVAGQASFVSHGRVVPTTGAEEFWQDHQLTPGPATKKTAAKTSYSIRITVKFLGAQQSAIVRATVTDPAGKKLEDWWGETEYEYEASGKSGEEASRVTLLVIQES